VRLQIPQGGFYRIQIQDSRRRQITARYLPTLPRACSPDAVTSEGSGR
jgi:hypothetical protein